MLTYWTTHCSQKKTFPNLGTHPRTKKFPAARGTWSHGRMETKNDVSKVTRFQTSLGPCFCPGNLIPITFKLWLNAAMPKACLWTTGFDWLNAPTHTEGKLKKETILILWTWAFFRLLLKTLPLCMVQMHSPPNIKTDDSKMKNGHSLCQPSAIRKESHPMSELFLQLWPLCWNFMKPHSKPHQLWFEGLPMFAISKLNRFPIFFM